MKMYTLSAITGIIAITVVTALKSGIAAEPEQLPPVTENGSWSRPSDEELRTTLTPLQYDVTQNEGTERAFRNEYWDNKQEGIC